MHPYITERLADLRRSELLAATEKHRRADAARPTPRSTRSTGPRNWLRLALFHRRPLRSRAHHS